MNRSLTEIKVRCSPILGDKKIVALVIDAASPTAAYDMVKTETKDVEKAKAARWLAIIRRDHPASFSKLMGAPIHPKPSHVSN